MKNQIKNQIKLQEAKAYLSNVSSSNHSYVKSMAMSLELAEMMIFDNEQFKFNMNQFAMFQKAFDKLNVIEL